MDNTNKWSAELPNSEGKYFMKDESGGPTLYEFKYINDELMYSNDEFKSFIHPAGTGMLKSARWVCHG